MASEPTVLDNPREARRAVLSLQRDVNFLRQVQKPVPATRILLFAVGLIFVLGYAVTAWVVEPRTGIEFADGLEGSLLLGAKINEGIQQGQVWRLVTHTFQHGGIVHLLFNAYALFLLGTLTERLFGTRRFIILYGISALGGAAASYFFNVHPSVGASGALFGLLGAIVVFGLKHRELIPERIAKALSSGMLPWLILSLAIGLIPSLPIDNAAHLGGLALGTLLAFLMSSPLAGPTPRWLHRVHGAVAVLLILIAIASLIGAIVYSSGCVQDRAAWDACSSILPRTEP